MGACYLCGADNVGYFTYYCEKCAKMKRVISLYGIDRVFEIIESVLVRTRHQQGHKIAIELDKEEVQIKSRTLRNGKNIRVE